MTLKYNYIYISIDNYLHNAIMSLYNDLTALLRYIFKIYYYIKLHNYL